MNAATSLPVPERTRPVLTCLNDDGSQSAVSVTTPIEHEVRAECLVTSRLVVPIVFVPGIMGTRLRVEGNADLAARLPPEGKRSALGEVFKTWATRSPAQRQTLLNPEHTEVDDNGPAHPDLDTALLLGDAPGDTDAERSRWRGRQLRAILGVLERQLARILVEGAKAAPGWAEPRAIGGPEDARCRKALRRPRRRGAAPRCERLLPGACRRLQLATRSEPA